MIVRSVEIVDAEGVAHRGLKSETDYFIVVTVEALVDVPNVTVGWVIKSESGLSIYGTSTAVQGYLSIHFRAAETKRVRFTFRPNLALGKYFISAGAAEMLTPEEEVHNYIMKDYSHDALSFVVAADVDVGITKSNVKLVSFQKV
ncbi:Wzt carbohydrate-binding domain-containing protein [Rhodopseudomonas palustris]|uniref:Wzt carbohydrate-binding domain-containing protein n=1 Tax=Rhodopseudomonas palustris TaxID=1076 RepID=UPI001403D6BE|nr:Wzt carbohydrate-binding domain-containing protein [Rhodopseudomonas palustris]QLH72209.1 Wzt carbohydrate-binding domain-containing protein [Rhodopseudomonas palustris]